jgi:NAD(P)-dependent dehydrogenase (short-subunit alcohol dehydrogenase family)
MTPDRAAHRQAAEDGRLTSIEERVAVVTGANRGIGRAIAIALASQGCRCVISARDRQRLDDVVLEIRKAGGTADAIALDLRSPDTPAQLVEFAVSRFGRLDILINNAGAARRGEFMALADEDFVDGFALKFFGAVRATRAAWPHLMTSKGSVLNIVGIGGRTPGAAFSIGGSVNAALLSFTKSLAATGLADGIQVNAINPGAIRTDRLKKRLQDTASKLGVSLDAAEKQFVADEKITRIGEPEDIAALAAFVVGPRGRFLHGALMDMDGGATKTI